MQTFEWHEQDKRMWRVMRDALIEMMMHSESLDGSESILRSIVHTINITDIVLLVSFIDIHHSIVKTLIMASKKTKLHKKNSKVRFSGSSQLFLMPNRTTSSQLWYTEADFDSFKTLHLQAVAEVRTMLPRGSGARAAALSRQILEGVEIVGIEKNLTAEVSERSLPHLFAAAVELTHNTWRLAQRIAFAGI